MANAIILITNPITPTMMYKFNLFRSTGSISIKRLIACTRIVKQSDISNIQLTIAPNSWARTQLNTNKNIHFKA
jgi:hypothetical protein